MAETIAQMTKKELRGLIESSLEQKLLDLFGDPDSGLEIRQTVRERLLK
ncbi:MAG: hypothetical protein JXA42_00420 [Anaerolineales bacterium]|nr:hypothetical protein [Anaerolineales bacterium]